jgi:hypothetical protein
MGYTSGLTSTQNVNITGGQTNFPMPGTGQVAKHFMPTGGKLGQAIVSGTGALLYTVTGGKTFYLTGISLGSNTGAAFELRDGTTIAGTLQVSGWAPTANSTGGWQVNFATPIPFTSGVFIDVGGNVNINGVFTGFEQ